jgi:hypothetical protein
VVDHDDIQNLIREGVAAARAGDLAEARELFQQVTEADPDNERGWLWLATVTNDPTEKRIYIENVLQINPDNDRAQQILFQLESEKREQQAKADELIPGVTRQRAILLGGGALGIWLLLMIILISVGVSRRSSFANTLTQTAVAIAQSNTQAAQVQTDQAATENALQVTQMFIEAQTATAEAEIQGPGGGATLPPTWTPTPIAEGPQGAGPTPTPLASVPFEQLQDNVLIGWGGQDRLNVGFYPIIGYQLGNGESRRLGGEFLVSGVDINPANGQELIFTRYFPETFDFSIILSNLSGNSSQRIADAWEPIDFLLEPEQVTFSPDGSGLTFIAPSSDTGSREVWYLNLNFSPQPGTSPLQRITRDGANYLYPAISPDNTRIAAIREDPEDLDPGPDIVIIEIEGGLQQIIKEDGSRTLEQHPAWVLPDGDLLAFSGRPQGENTTHDIIALNLRNPAAPAQFLVRNVQANASHPVFSADGQFMAFASDLTGELNIFIRNNETEEIYQLTNDNDQIQIPGGWYQPGQLTGRPQTTIPTPIRAN